MPIEAETLTFVALLLPFPAAVAAPFLTRVMGHRAAWALALVPLAIFLHFASLAEPVADGATLTGALSWVPGMGVELSWLLDGLSLTFALLVSGIGTLIVLYSGGYLKGHPRQGRFFSFMLLFMGAMQGLVLADGLVTLFVFWELTTITSFLLIGFDNRRKEARRAALQALVVTGMGGLSLLAGLLVMWQATGSAGLSGLLASGEAMRASPLYGAALALVLFGAFTKSAQVPFHFWLPNAMEAPTPVSAYLHSATMVKAGVYLLMRLNPVLGGTSAWETCLPLFGGATFLAGALLALRQVDLKLMLAYTTVASLGLLVLLVGLGSDEAIAAAALYLVAHSFFKGALFMVAGTVDHEAGSRDLTRISGLGRAMPVTFAAALLAGASMAGLPLTFGFLAKEEIYAAATGGNAPALLALVFVAGNALMAAVALAVALSPFLGAPRAPRQAHEGSVLLWAGPVVLALKGITAALLAAHAHRFVSMPMAGAIAGRPVMVEISAGLHVGLPLLLSALTLALGVAGFLLRKRLRSLLGRLLEAIGWGPDRGFDHLLRGMLRAARAVALIVQGGRLHVYSRVTFAVVAAALLIGLAAGGETPRLPSWPVIAPHAWAVLAMAVAGLLAVLRARSRLTAIVSLGIQGLAVALIFILLGAPDLSFTQFMIETLSVVILALVMTRLRLDVSDHRPMRARLVDGAIAACGGAGFALLLLKVVELPFDPSLSEFFSAYSRIAAHGRNIVNVIIVDFRGLDTLGEISVVMIAGLAILTLIRMTGKSTHVKDR